MQMDPLTSYSMYELDNWVTREVVGQLQHITPFSGIVLLVAGCQTHNPKHQTLNHLPLKMRRSKSLSRLP